MSAQPEDKRKKALEVLDLPESAGPAMARIAFRKLAFGCHPDLHGGDPAKARQFRELAEAHRIVLESPASAPPPGHPWTSPPEPVRGRDLHYRLRLNFIQAALGGEVLLRYERQIACPACKSGKKTDCLECRGTGCVQAGATPRIRVPSGIEEGEILRLRGLGEESPPGGGPGDLHLLVSIRTHPALKRRGLDIYSEAKLPGSRLREGGSIEVPTIGGERQIHLPPHTFSGRIFQLKGAGIVRRAGDFTERGDHFVRVEAIRNEAEIRAAYLSSRRAVSAAAKGR
jgi:DnaJ-class molecular chaperone